MTNKITQQNIPKSWIHVSVADIAEVQTGPFGSQLHESDYVKDGTPIITVENLRDGFVKITTDTPTVKKVDVERLKKYTLKEGDVVFSRVGSVDRSSYVTKEQEGWMFSGRILRVRAKNGTNSKFLNHYFAKESTKNTIRNLAVGGTMPSLNTAIFNYVPAYSIPEPEQNRIVAVLETWDQAIEKLKRKIEVKKEIKKGLMQELLSGKSRIAGYNDEWVNHELEDLLKPTSEKYNPVIDNYSFKCIELEHLQKDDSKLLGFTDSKLQKSIKNVFKKGDVLFGKLRPYLRKFLRTEFDGVCSTEIWVLKSSKFIDSNYAYYLVQSDKFVNVANVSSGSRMPRADWGYMKSVNFTIPGKIDEQKAIVRVLDTADNEVRILIKKLSFLNNQKKYLLNNLITGTIRTPETLSIPK